MNTQKENFQTKLFNLEGVQFTERKKNFSKLLKSINPEDLKNELDFEPRTHLERIFYVDALIHAKEVDKLIDILKEGIGILVSRILKQSWFFKEVFGSMNGAEIVNAFLPSLSHVVRMKVMKKIALAVDEEKMDEIFDNFIDRYGFFMAQSFLFGCSPTKIADMLKIHPFHLSIEQLKRILDIDTNLVKLYFQTYEKNNGHSFDNTNFLSYMYRKYPKLYFELDYHGGSLGLQTSKKILELDTDNVLDIDRTLENLHPSAVTRKIPNFEAVYFVRVFPDTIEGLSSYHLSEIIQFLRKYPVGRRWNVFALAFSKKYQKDLNDYLHILHRNIATMFSEDVRRRWGKLKFIEEDELIYLNEFRPVEALPIIKDRINITSDISKRLEMLELLIKLCHKKQDYTTYSEVLQYIYSRHQNEKEYVRRNLLSRIANNVDIRLTSEGHWVFINQMIDVCRAKNETLPVRNMAQYIIFLLTKSLVFNDAISQYVDFIVTGDLDGWGIQYFECDIEIRKQVIEEFMKRLNHIENQYMRKNLALSLMDTIIDLNDKHEHIDLNKSDIIASYVNDIVDKRCIENYEDVRFLTNAINYNYGKRRIKPLELNEDHLMEAVKSLKPESREYNHVIEVLCKVTKKPRWTEFQQNLIPYLFSQINYDTYDYFRELIFYCLKSEPELIVKYSQTIFDVEKRGGALLDIKLVKLYSHLKLDENLINHLQDSVKLDKIIDESQKNVLKLSKIMSSTDYVNLIEEYFPHNQLENINLEQQAMQFEIIKALRNVDDPRDLISYLSRFCQGTYFQPSIPVLYKTVYHLNEFEALKSIHMLRLKSVSVRKHSVFLGFEVLPQKVSLDLFNIVATSENNPSSKKYLFRGLLKYFMRNPSESLLVMLAPCFELVGIKDRELFENLIESIEKVPLAFSPLYCEYLLRFFDEIEERGAKVAEYRQSLLRFINRCSSLFFEYVKDMFFEKLVTAHFLSKDFDLYNFVVHFLLFKGEASYYDLVFKLVAERKALYPHQCKLFFDCFYEAVRSLDQLKIFKLNWEKTFTHEERFLEYVCLQLLFLFYMPEEDFHGKVNTFLLEITSQYGAYTSPFLCDALEKFLQRLVHSKLISNIEEFVLKLLKVDSNIFNCLIASKLCRPNEEILDILKGTDNPTARIIFNRYYLKSASPHNY